MAIGVPIDSVDGSTQDLLKHGASPSPDKQVPPFADSSSQVVRFQLQWGQQLGRSQGWLLPNPKPSTKEIILKKLIRCPGQTMLACAHFLCQPLFLASNCKEQAGRSQGFHNRVRDPKDAFHGLRFPVPAFQGTSGTDCMLWSFLSPDFKEY